MPKEPETIAATADDVAELAGVLRWTVHRACKSDASISEKSRNRVLEAAVELEYVPDLLAASLASDRTNLVSLLIDDFSNPHKLVMLESLTRILRQNGWASLDMSNGLVQALKNDTESVRLDNFTGHLIVRDST